MTPKVAKRAAEWHTGSQACHVNPGSFAPEFIHFTTILPCNSYMDIDGEMYVCGEGWLYLVVTF